MADCTGMRPRSHTTSAIALPSLPPIPQQPSLETALDQHLFAGRPQYCRTRSRSAGDSPHLPHLPDFPNPPPRVQRFTAMQMHDLASTLDLEVLPSYEEVARDRPPPISPVHPRRHTVGAVSPVWSGPPSHRGPGWVRDSDGQWRQGRRTQRPVHSQTCARPTRPLQLEHGQAPGHLQPGQVVLRPPSHSHDEPAGNGKVWRKRMGVWYVTTPSAKPQLEQIGPQGERWRRTFGVWYVVS